MDDTFCADFKQTPHCWEQPRQAQIADLSFPTEVDALIIESGYTGLKAALETARAGRGTLVADAEACTTRRGIAVLELPCPVTWVCVSHNSC